MLVSVPAQQVLVKYGGQMQCNTHNLPAFENEHKKSPKKQCTTYTLNTMSKVCRLHLLILRLYVLYSMSCAFSVRVALRTHYYIHTAHQMHHSLWVDMIHTNNDRAANMSAHTNTQLSVLRASATALDTHNARASSACGGARPATLWTRPGGSRPPPMRPPASGQANLARRLVDECLAMLNLSSSERAPSSRRECDSCARASGGMVVSRDKRR